MPRLDLDNVEPETLQRIILDGAVLRLAMRNDRLRGELGRLLPRAYPDRIHRGASRDSKVGIDAKRLLDWRDLERRWFAAKQATADVSSRLWDGLRILYRYAKDNGMTPEVIIPMPSGTACWVYSDNGLSNRMMDTIIKEGIRNPNYRPYILQGEDAAVVIKLREREECLRKRAWLYIAAFRLAIEYRLSHYVEDELQVADVKSRYFRPALFIIENEGRQHVVRNEYHGSLKWEEMPEVMYVS